MKAIGYVRVSTDRQAELGVSLEAQEAKIRAVLLDEIVRTRAQLIRLRMVLARRHFVETDFVCRFNRPPTGSQENTGSNDVLPASIL